MIDRSGRMARWKARVRALKTEVHALFLAYRDPRVPWQAKLVAALVVAYAVSPIDLIPDFIPLLGYLDDLIILPLGIMLAVKMIPAVVMEESRARAGGDIVGEKEIQYRHRCGDGGYRVDDYHCCRGCFRQKMMARPSIL